MFAGVLSMISAGINCNCNQGLVYFYGTGSNLAVHVTQIPQKPTMYAQTSIQVCNFALTRTRYNINIAINVVQLWFIWYQNIAGYGRQYLKHQKTSLVDKIL